MHYGVDNMHWGDRRYQDKNGRLTPEGKLHYAELRAKAAHRKKFDEQKELREDKRRYKKAADDFREFFSTTARPNTKEVENEVQIKAELTELGLYDSRYPYSMVKYGEQYYLGRPNEIADYITSELNRGGPFGKIELVGRYTSEEDAKKADANLIQYREKNKKKDK